MSLTQQTKQVATDRTLPKPRPSRFRRARIKFFRALGLVVAFVATVSLAAGVAVVGPNVDEWRGVLPTLDDTGYGDDGVQRASEVFGWSQDREQAGAQLPGPETESTDFAFLAPGGAGLPGPGHWCSTEQIGYRIDLTGARLAGLDQNVELERWQMAFDRWSAASGDRYQFAYRGQAEYPLVPGSQKREMKVQEERIPAGEIAITYATAEKSPGEAWAGYEHRGLATAYALGGIGSVKWSSDDPDSGLITSGSVMIDANDVPPPTRSVPAVYVHEAGHALGLAHVDDEAQMMFTNAPPSAKISSGDREGIRTLASAACPG